MANVFGGWVNIPFVPRLIRRLNISQRQLIETPGWFDGKIQGVIDIDQMAMSPDIYKPAAALDLTGAGWVDVYVVPRGKFVRLLGWYKPATAGSCAIALEDPHDDRFQFTAAQTAAGYTVLPGKGLPLAYGWSVIISASGNGADAAITPQIILEIYDDFTDIEE